MPVQEIILVAVALVAGWAIAHVYWSRTVAKLRHDQSFADATGHSVEALARFRRAIDACTDSVYVVDRETMKFVDVSASALSITGFTREEMLAMSPVDLIQGATHESLNELYNQVIVAGKAGIHTETVSLRKNGRVILSDNHRCAITIGGRVYIVSVARDTTDRKAAEAARERAIGQLKNAETRLERAINGAQDGLWELNILTKQVWVSDRFGSMLGYPPLSFASDKNKFFDIVHRDDIENLQMAIADSLAMRMPVDIELRARTSGEEWRWYRLRAAVQLDASGKPTTLSGSQQDITERRHYQEALIEATDSAARANRSKSEFLANMSHEIRTPMNGVIGMTELLMDTTLTSTQLDYARTVHGSATALVKVINDILDFSKIEAGKLELESIEMNVRNTIEEVTRLLAVQAHSKGLEMIATIAPEIPELVVGDAGRLRQVLLNIGSNAVKFTAQGEVVIEFDIEATSADSLLLRCEVRDTGMGIPASRVSALFSAFTQADTSMTRKYGGTGLGLSIVKQLVELMGGDVGVTSEEGVGSTFWFTARFGLTHKSAQTLDTTELRNVRVLLVEDNATAREAMMNQLSLCGVAASSAGSADDALLQLRQAAAAKLPFQIVVIDNQMPQCDGLQLSRLIRDDATISATRRLLLTSSDRRSDAQSLAALGIVACVLKPGTQRELVSSLKLALDTSNSHSINVTPVVEDQKVLQLLESPHAVSCTTTRDVVSAVRLLLVEDNAVNQKVAMRLLEKMGYAVDMVSDGKQAVEAWSTGRYSLILMDCQMPVMDGYEATRTIREREPDGVRIPIVALTAHAMQGADNHCTAAGMDDYLSKPIDRERMKTTIARWLANEAAVSALAK